MPMTQSRPESRHSVKPVPITTTSYSPSAICTHPSGIQSNEGWTELCMVPEFVRATAARVCGRGGGPAGRAWEREVSVRVSACVGGLRLRVRARPCRA